MILEKTQLMEGINECGKVLCSKAKLIRREMVRFATLLLWNSDALAHPKLTAIQVRCIVNQVSGASGKLFQRIRANAQYNCFIRDGRTCVDRPIF